MANLEVRTNQNSVVDVTVRESDVYSKSVFLRFNRISSKDEARGCHEMYFTPAQLDQLGRFFIRQAEEIRVNQEYRSTLV